MVDRQTIRKQLPKGYCTVVAKRAGVTSKSVSEYFANRINSEKIENEALKVLAELKQSKQQLINAAQ